MAVVMVHSCGFRAGNPTIAVAWKPGTPNVAFESMLGDCAFDADASCHESARGYPAPYRGGGLQTARR
jgi:hypothetical protein